MTTNKYFSLHTNTQVSEQNLYEDLIIESIQMTGIDVLYLPRELVVLSEFFGESLGSKFTSAYEIEMYVKSVHGFEGAGDIISHFGLEIRDELNLSVSKKRFGEEISSSLRTRPIEGDLIYFPLNKKLFEISFVQHEPNFYQAGKNYTYDLTCNLFEYNNEKFATSNTLVDSFETTRLSDMLEISFDTGNNVDFILGETVYQTNSTSNIATAIVYDWNHITSNVANTLINSYTVVLKDSNGTFIPSANVIGFTSNGQYRFSDYSQDVEELDFINGTFDNENIISLDDLYLGMQSENPFGIILTDNIG